MGNTRIRQLIALIALTTILIICDFKHILAVSATLCLQFSRVFTPCAILSYNSGMLVVSYVFAGNRHLVSEVCRPAGRGIPSRPYFSPIHLQSFYREKFGYQRGDFPVTEELGDYSLALPFSSVMTEEQVEIVCHHLEQSIAHIVSATQS